MSAAQEAKPAGVVLALRPDLRVFWARTGACMVVSALTISIAAVRAGSQGIGFGFSVLLFPAGAWLLSCCLPGAYALTADSAGLTVRRSISRTSVRWEAVTGIAYEQRHAGKQGLQWFIVVSVPRRRFVGGALFIRDTYSMPLAELAFVLRALLNEAKSANALSDAKQPG